MIIDQYFTENDQTIHVVNRAAIAKYNVPASIAADFFKIDDDLYISTHLTFGMMAQFVLGDATFDYAIPASLWHTRSDWRDCVYLYDEKQRTWGMYNVKATFREFVRQLSNQERYNDNSTGAI